MPLQVIDALTVVVPLHPQTCVECPSFNCHVVEGIKGDSEIAGVWQQGVRICLNSSLCDFKVSFSHSTLLPVSDSRV